MTDTSNLSNTEPKFGQKPDGSSYRFFIVDDSPFIIKNLQKMIESFGGIVVGNAPNGLKTLSSLKEMKEPVDIITLDINMPEMDGITTLPMLKSVMPGTQIVIVSAMGKKDKIKKSIEMGASHYMIKPLKQDYVFKTLHYITNNLQLQHGQKRMLNLNGEPLRVFAIEKNEKSAESMHTILDWFGCNILGISSNCQTSLIETIKSVGTVLDAVILNLSLEGNCTELIKKILSINTDAYVLLITEDTEAQELREYFKLDVYKKIRVCLEENVYDMLKSLFPVK